MGSLNLGGVKNAAFESSLSDFTNCSVNTVLLSSYTMSPWSTDNEIADEPEGLLVAVAWHPAPPETVAWQLPLPRDPLDGGVPGVLLSRNAKPGGGDRDFCRDPDDPSAPNT